MLRSITGAVAVVLCLAHSAQADPTGPDSVRICDRESGCRYVHAAEAGGKARGARLLRAAGGRENARTRGSVLTMATLGSGALFSGGGSLVAEARRYEGMNRAQLGMKHRAWCGEFLGRVARASGVRTPENPAKASNWRSVGTRISSPRPGAIALVARGGGIGHVGIVTGVDGNGNPILISGNYRNRVVETAYPRRRIVGYVWPGR